MQANTASIKTVSSTHSKTATANTIPKQLNQEYGKNLIVNAKITADKTQGLKKIAIHNKALM